MHLSAAIENGSQSLNAIKDGKTPTSPNDLGTESGARRHAPTHPSHRPTTVDRHHRHIEISSRRGQGFAVMTAEIDHDRP
jgi:hypothetical protein